MHTGIFNVIAVVACAAVCGTGVAEELLVLAERGKPGEFSVVLPESPTESERFAASELKTYVERLTGVVLDETGSRKIRLVRAENELGPDGFRLRAQGNDLELRGGRYGLLYAVYEILETYGGVEWFSPECEVVPRLDRLELPANLDRTERPAFEGREVLWSAIAENPDHATRMRLHGIYTGFKPRHAGNIYRFGGGLMNCHTFHKLVPKAKYAKAHPEYFAMRGGKRVTEADEGAGMQLCLSNKDVEDIVVAGILDAIRRDPEATYFGLSQNDNEVYCECPACAAADAEEGTHAGAQMRFVNRVAERIEKVHPDKIIETLAYQYTRKAPKKTRLRKNVMPCLCSIECDFSHPLASGLYSQNVSFREDLRNWAKMTDRLYVWDYTVNFSNYPGIFPNYNVLQPNLKFFRDNGVKSVFEQGAHGGARGAEFEVLKAWLLSKWLWNPDYDEEKLLTRFFRGYYGQASRFVRKYFDVLRALPRPDSEKQGLRVFSSVDSTNLVSDTFLAQASKCWRLAAAAAEKDGRDDVRRNVMLGEFSVDYMRFLRLKNRYAITPGIRLRTVPPAADGELGDFVDLVKRIRAVLVAEPRVKFSESAGIDKGMRRQIDEALAGLDASKFKPSNRCFLEADRFNLLGAGRTMFRENDAEASEGKCLRVALNKYSWDAQLPVTLATFDPGVRYVVRLRAKIELKPNAPEGRVFDCGVHDPQQGKGLANWSILTSQVKSGVWHWYDLGEFLPAGSPYFWMSGGYFDPKKYADNPCAERVFVDRFEIIRKDAVAVGRSALAVPQAVLCDPHEWLYDDSQAADVKPYAETDVPANGVAEANVLVTGLDPAKPVDVSSDAPDGAWYRLVPVAVEKNTGLYGAAVYPSPLTNLWVTRSAPFRVCDAMEPVVGGRMAVDAPTVALRFRLVACVPAGRRRIRLSVRQGDFKAELPFVVNVHAVRLPAVGAKSYKYTNWINYDSIARCHGLEPWSEAHYAMIERYVRLAVRSRQSMAWVPLFLSTNGVPDEARIVRLVKTLDRAGIAWICGQHFCGFYRKRWHFPSLATKGSEWPVTTAFGAQELARAAAGLNAILERHGLKDRWYQHVADEPSPQHVADYRVACAIVRKNMPGVRLFDATETTEIAGLLDAYCPKSYVYEESQGQHNGLKTSPTDEMWCYTCCFPGGRSLNRLLDKDPLQSVLLPWGCRRFGLDGYLHWGYNQFGVNNDPLKRTIGDAVLKAEVLPPGDRNVVYAGKEGPWPSVRLEAMRQGMEDAELWKMLADRDRVAADRLMHRLVRGFSDYETDHAKYREVRRELLEAASRNP